MSKRLTESVAILATLMVGRTRGHPTAFGEALGVLALAAMRAWISAYSRPFSQHSASKHSDPRQVFLYAEPPLPEGVAASSLFLRKVGRG